MCFAHVLQPLQIEASAAGASKRGTENQNTNLQRISAYLFVLADEKWSEL
jgi:hypothetical protein